MEFAFRTGHVDADSLGGGAEYMLLKVAVIRRESVRPRELVLIGSLALGGHD